MTAGGATSPVSPWDWYPRPLPPNVVFGRNCWLPTAYSFHRYRSRRPCGLLVGDDTSFGASSSFDIGPDGEVVVGSTCNVVGALFQTNGRIALGHRVLVSTGVTFADHAWPVPPVPFDEQRYRSLMPPGSETSVGDDVWIGIGASVLGGVVIGHGAIIGAASVVDVDIPPYAVYAGNPGRVVGWAHPEGSPSVDGGVGE